jgi:AAA domain/CHC2 zinc finger
MSDEQAESGAKAAAALVARIQARARRAAEQTAPSVNDVAIDPITEGRTPAQFSERFLDELRAALPVLKVVSRRHKMRKEGQEYRAEDNHSLCVNPRKNVWSDFGSNGSNGGDIFAFEMHATGCTFPEAVKTLAKLAGIALPDERQGRQRAARKREIVATYDYRDADGAPIYQVVRYEPKDFSQRRPVPNEPGKWIWGLTEGQYIRGRNGDFYFATEQRLRDWKGAELREFEGVARGLYRFPELREEMAQDPDKRRPIFVPEGEKDCDTLAAWGLVATTNSGGADNWKPYHAEELRGADVVILPDNDVAGRKHAKAVAQSLQGIAKRVRVLHWPDHWPGCPPKGDVTEWRDEAGGNIDAFLQIIDHLMEWQPQPSGAGTAFKGEGAENPKANRPKTFNAEELNQMRFDPIKFVVPGYIVEGLTLFAGKPKIGKSWLLLHAALAVARGGFTLGDTHCQEGDVLYAALEDNPRRLQSRMTKLLGISPWPPRLHFICEMPRLTAGGLNFVKRWIEGAKQPRLVIIDTLAMVRMPNRPDTSTYDADYAAVKDLRDLAHKYGIAIVLVHHLRKAEADDAFDMISGTLGLTGAPDTVMVLKRNTSGTMLHARGRDLTEIEKVMTFNTETCVWTVLGDAAAVRGSRERNSIIEALNEAGDEPLGPNQIATACGMKAANVRFHLGRLKADGLVTKVGYGKYTLNRSHSHTSAHTGQEPIGLQ